MRLPESANNVQYAFYHEWIAALELVRFDASVQDCRAVAEEIVAKHNAENPDRRILLVCDQSTLRDMIRSSQPFRSARSRCQHPGSIRKRFERGWWQGRSEATRRLFWIDTERGVLFSLTDSD